MGRRRILVLVDGAGLNPATEALLNDAQIWAVDSDLRFVVRNPGNISQSLSILGPVWNLGQPLDAPTTNPSKPSHWNDFALDWNPDVLYASSVGAITIGDQIDLPHVPLLLYVYDEGHWIGRAAPGRKNLFIDRPDAYVAPSSGCARFLTDRLFIPPGKITVSNPSITRRRFEQLAATIRTPNKQFTVGSLGGAAWLTGSVQWLYLCRELFLGDHGDQFSCKRLGVFGGSLEDHRFQHSLRLLEVAPKMELVHDQGQMVEFISSLDVLAVTSWQDTSVTHILTAMALGIPVVCFQDNLATAETLADTGMAIESYDVREMATAIRKLASDAEAAGCLGLKERARVKDCFVDSGSSRAVLMTVDDLAVRN